MLVRCTAKALSLVGRAEFTTDAPDDSNEWYLNLVWLERRKCLLLVHATTLYPTFVADVRRTDVQPLGAWVTSMASDALADEDLDRRLFGPLDPNRVVTAKTASRQLLGFMNEMALHVRYAAIDAGSLQQVDLTSLNHSLRRTLHRVDGQFVTPLELATALPGEAG